jgi:hypothetical protein
MVRVKRPQMSGYDALMTVAGWPLKKNGVNWAKAPKSGGGAWTSERHTVPLSATYSPMVETGDGLCILGGSLAPVGAGPHAG